MSEVDPHYFRKLQFLLKISTINHFWGFRGKNYSFGALRGVVGKSEESRPPLKLKNNRGTQGGFFPSQKFSNLCFLF